MLTLGVLRAQGTRREPVDAEAPKSTDEVMELLSSEDARERRSGERRAARVRRSETTCLPG